MDINWGYMNMIIGAVMIVIGASVIAILIQFIYKKILKILKYYLPSKNQLNFQDDIIFLDHLILFYMKKVLFDFETMNTDIDIINNPNYKTLLSEIVDKVTKSLSEDYLSKLNNYFNYEYLLTYIINHVDYELTQYLMTKNVPK